MFNNPKTKNIILALLLSLTIIFLAYLGTKINLEETKAGLQKLTQAVNYKLEVFGQKVSYQVFPRYPQRLSLLASDLMFQSETLFLLDQELTQLVEACDCQYTQSACFGGKSPAQAQKTIQEEISLGLSPEMAKKIDTAVASIDTKIRESIFQAETETKNAFEKIRTELNKIKLKGGQKGPEAKLKFFPIVQAEDVKIIEKAEERLKKIEDQTLGELKRKEKEITKNIESYKEKFKGELAELKNYPEGERLIKLENVFQGFLQDTEGELKKIDPKKIGGDLDVFLQDFSQQLTGLPSQIFSGFQANLQGILTGLKGELDNTLNLQNIFAFVKNPLSFLFQGGCRPSPIGTFGDPCLNVRKAIENNQTEIEAKIRQVLYLQSLLKKEMETGLKEELEKLLPRDLFKELEANISQLIQNSQDVISQAEKNKNLSYQNLVSKCSANCQLGNVFGLKSCLAAGTGEQRAIELKFKAGVGLEDLNLGQVGIKSINLNLPKKIEKPEFGTFSPFTILGDRVMIDIEKASGTGVKPPPIQLQVPSPPSLPKPPAFSFSCANLTNEFSSYSCDSTSQMEDGESIENEWYFKFLGWLMETCVNLPTMSDIWGLKEKAADCYDPEKVIKTINTECQNLWDDYCKSGTPPGPEFPAICQKIRNSCRDKDGKAASADRCQELFSQEGEPIPSSCTYSVNPDGIYLFPLDFNPINTLQKKCTNLKKANKKEPPEPCKILPLFAGQIRKPADEIYINRGGNCPSQKISDAPSSIPGCGASPPTIPKIRLPKIIVPDIHLPYFRIPLLLEVKLPNFIFEDLVLPDIDLCDLDDCREVFPDLKFKLPILTFPRINLPPIELGEILGVPLPDIHLPSIGPPSIPFPFFKLPSLGDIMMPDLSLPSLPLPQPKITFGFQGIDVGTISAYIKTFILNAVGVPDFSLCIDFNLKLIPVQISFPDYYSYWPEFPKIPEISYCKDTRQFCRDAKTKLKEVTDQVKIIERTFDQFSQKEIQDKLDQTAIKIQEKYKQYILQELERQRERIRKEAEEQIERGEREIIIQVDDIKVPAISFDEELGLPDEIPIPWPEKLKKINLTKPWTYDLPKIPLNKLGYEKEVPVKGPGFQERTFTSDFGAYGDCLAGSPSGGNPYPISQFQSNLNGLEIINANLQETSRKIIQIIQVGI